MSAKNLDHAGHHTLAVCCPQWKKFNELGELVNHHEKVLVASRRHRQGPNYVHAELFHGGSGPLTAHQPFWLLPVGFGALTNLAASHILGYVRAHTQPHEILRNAFEGLKKAGVAANRVVMGQSQDQVAEMVW